MYQEFLPDVVACKDQATFDKEMPLNRQAWQAMREQIRRDHLGQFVALAQGRLVAVAPTFHEAEAAVQALQPVPDCYVVFNTDNEPPFDLTTLDEET